MHLRGAQTGEVYIAAQASLDAREGGGGGECDRLQLPGAVSEQKPSARVAAFFIIVDARTRGTEVIREGESTFSAREGGLWRPGTHSFRQSSQTSQSGMQRGQAWEHSRI